MLLMTKLQQKNKVKFYQRSTGKAPFDTNAYVTAVGNESGNENG